MNSSVLPLHLSMLNGGRQARQVLEGLKQSLQTLLAFSDGFPHQPVNILVFGLDEALTCDLLHYTDILLSDAHLVAGTKPPIRLDHLSPVTPP